MKASVFALLSAAALLVSSTVGRVQWTADQANQWYANSGWFAGCNFIPSTAVNVLEMWQADTFDLPTINRELGYAAGIGFKVIRVFLHPLVWQQDPSNFKARMDQFLSVADSHGIKTLFVMFDDCWNPEGFLGPQPAPIPSVHNSRWVQSPGANEHTNQTMFSVYKIYFLDVIGQFKDDSRVLMWDIYNEPGNSDHLSTSMPLLQGAFSWARQANPSQPISSGIWNWGIDYVELNNYQLKNSDVITFHIYSNQVDSNSTIQDLKIYGRPMIVTEYMARPLNSTFETHIPLFYQQNVSAINWGLVKGKTNTIYPWWSKQGDPEPAVWFHDVFWPNGTAFNGSETTLIRNTTMNFTMPVIPTDFEGACDHYKWDGKSIQPLGTWGTQRWSTKFNKIYEVSGTYDDDYNQITNAGYVIDSNSQSRTTYTEGQTCSTVGDKMILDVQNVINGFFNGFTFKGAQYAPWDLTRVKYYRLDGPGIQYYYKLSNQVIRFIAYPGATETVVFDFKNGWQPKTFTNKDLTLQQCYQA